MLSPTLRRRRMLAAAITSAAALTLPASAPAAPGDLTTIAGGPGGGLATTLGLVPAGLTVAAGDLLVADQQNGTVRAVDLATGEATALVGTGAAGSSAANLISGRPGPLTQLPGYAASVAGPLAVTTSADGDVIFSVGGGGTVRRLDHQTGVVTRIAGTGTFSSAGSGDGGPATEAGLGLVRGLAVDGDGSVLLADSSSGRVRRIDPSSGEITTVAGGGAILGDGGPAASAKLTDPRQIALEPGSGNLLVAEYGGHRVRRIEAGANGRIEASDTITTLAGDGTAATPETLGDGGPATAGRLNAPAGVALLPNGAIAIAEGAGNRLRLVLPSGVITTVPTAALGSPAALATRGSNRIYVAETSASTRRVQEVTVDPATGALASPGAVRTVAGNGSTGFSGHGTPAIEAQLGDPRAVTVAPDGSYYIADNQTARVRRVDPSTGRIRTIIGSGTTCPNATDPSCVEGVPAREAKITRPWDVAVARDGTVYVLESNAAISRISRLDPATGVLHRLAGGAVGFAGDGEPATAARFNEAQGIVLDESERYLYVADTNNRRVRRIDLEAEEAEPAVTTIAGTGALGDTGDGGPATEARLQGLLGIALAADGDILLPDNTARAIRRISRTTGIITTVFAAEETGHHDHDHDHEEPGSELVGLARVADRGNGRFVVADPSGHAVYAAEAHGDHYDVNRIAGTGTRDFTGESGAARGTALANPYDVAVGRGGELLIADTGNNRIRRVEFGPDPVSGDDPAGDAPAAPGPAPAPASTAPVAPPTAEARSARPPRVGPPVISTPPRTVRALAAGLTVRTTIRGIRRVRVELLMSEASARLLGLRGRRILARTSRDVKGDATLTLRVRPSAATRRRMTAARRRGEVKITVRVVGVAPGQPAQRTSRQITLRIG